MLFSIIYLVLLSHALASVRATRGDPSSPSPTPSPLCYLPWDDADAACAAFLAGGATCQSQWNTFCQNDNPAGAEFNTAHMYESGCSQCAGPSPSPSPSPSPGPACGCFCPAGTCDSEDDADKPECADCLRCHTGLIEPCTLPEPTPSPLCYLTWDNKDAACAAFLAGGATCQSQWNTFCPNDNPAGAEFNTAHLYESGCSQCATLDDECLCPGGLEIVMDATAGVDEESGQSYTCLDLLAYIATDGEDAPDCPTAQLNWGSVCCVGHLDDECLCPGSLEIVADAIAGEDEGSGQSYTCMDVLAYLAVAGEEAPVCPTAQLYWGSVCCEAGSAPPAPIRYERKYCTADGLPMYEVCEGCGAARGACSGDCTNDGGGHADCKDISWAEGGVSTKAVCRGGVHLSLHFDEAGCTGELVAELEEQADCYMVGQDDGFLGACTATQTGDPITSYHGRQMRYWLSTEHFTPVFEQGPFVMSQLAGPANPPPALEAYKGAWVIATEVAMAGQITIRIEAVDPTALLGHPNATAPPAADDRRLTSVHLSVGGKQLAIGDHTLSALDMTVSARRVPTRKIGTGFVEQVEIKAIGLHLRITSSKANKFADETMQVLGLHLDLEFLAFDESAVRGALPEMWGLQPMSEKTQLLLDKENVGN